MASDNAYVCYVGSIVHIELYRTVKLFASLQYRFTFNERQPKTAQVSLIYLVVNKAYTPLM